MRDVGQELAAGAVRGLERLGAARQFVGHAVERSRDRRHLVAAPFGRARREIAAAEPFSRVLHRLQTPLRRPEDEKRDERHSHDEHAGRDDGHRRTKLARDTRDRRPRQHRDAANGIARHKDRHGLPRPLWRELHRAGGVGREPPIRSTAIAPATTAAATTTAASAARGEVTPSRFECDRVL